MVGLVVGVAEERPHAVQQPLEDAVLQGTGQPPRGLGAEPLTERGLVVVEEAPQRVQHRLQELVGPVLGGHDAEHPAGDHRQGKRVHRGLDLLGQHPVHVLVADQVGHRYGGVGRVPCHHVGVLRHGQPRRGPLCGTKGPHPVGDVVGAQEVLLHELPERGAELVLALRDDRRVRDR